MAWQDRLGGMKQRLDHILSNELLADVIFLVGAEQPKVSFALLLELSLPSFGNIFEKFGIQCKFGFLAGSSILKFGKLSSVFSSLLICFKLFKFKKL